MTNLDSSQGHKDGSTYVNQCDKLHQPEPMILSIDAEKALDKIHPFTIKPLQQWVQREHISTQEKLFMTKTICNRLNLEKLKAFWLKSGPRCGCPLSPLLVNTLLEVLPTVIGGKKK